MLCVETGQPVIYCSQAAATHSQVPADYLQAHQRLPELLRLCGLPTATIPTDCQRYSGELIADSAQSHCASVFIAPALIRRGLSHCVLVMIKRPVRPVNNRPDSYSGTSTGLCRSYDHYCGRSVRIICLDSAQRLPFSFAISDSRCGYREFRTLSAAKRFARTL